MPRFAILTHDHPFPHWDFLLEAGEACRTWRLLDEPGAGRTVRAKPIAEHRLHYLTYDGPVSGNRGTVTRWDTGSFEWIASETDRVEVELVGERLCGRCTIAASDFATHDACVFAAHNAAQKRKR
ncbi:MAG: DNA polymerase ligase N-terminal domain-containing protein [Planctomycetaceae bacterium]